MLLVHPHDFEFYFDFVPLFPSRVYIAPLIDLGDFLGLGFFLGLGSLGPSDIFPLDSPSGFGL